MDLEWCEGWRATKLVLDASNCMLLRDCVTSNCIESIYLETTRRRVGKTLSRHQLVFVFRQPISKDSSCRMQDVSREFIPGEGSVRHDNDKRECLPARATNKGDNVANDLVKSPDKPSCESTSFPSVFCSFSMKRSIPRFESSVVGLIRE